MLNEKTWENIKKALVFTLTPTAEVFVTQPFLSLMKQVQSTEVPKPPVNLSPNFLYQGTGYNLGGFTLTIGMQMALTDAIIAKMGANPSDEQKTASAFIAGVASSLIACPTDALITWKQSPAGTACPPLFKSMPATMLQEGTCSVFFLVVAPMIESMLKPHIESQSLLSFASGTASGLAAGVLSHPANTIRTIQQKSLTPQSFFKTGSQIVANNGIGGLFQGLLPRCKMIGLSMATMVYFKKLLEDSLDEIPVNTCKV